MPGASEHGGDVDEGEGGEEGGRDAAFDEAARDPQAAHALTGPGKAAPQVLQNRDALMLSLDSLWCRQLPF